MMWMKAGRKSTKQMLEMPENEKSEQYTKKELRIFKNGAIALAAAVVDQWIQDGKPSADYPGVLPYICMLKAVFKEQDKKKLLSKLSMEAADE